MYESNANNVCLSEFPDSAWANGHPNNVNMQGISSRSVVTGPKVDFSLYENLPIKIKYEYLGTNCSLRTVVISKVLNPNITETTIDEYFKLYEQSSSNLFAAREQLLKFNESLAKLNKLEEALKVSRLNEGVLIWNDSSRVASGIVFDLATNSRFSDARSLPIIEFDPQCIATKSFEEEAEYRNFRKYWIFIPPLFNATSAKVPPMNITMKASSCNAKISIFLGGSQLSSGTFNYIVSLEQLNNQRYKITLRDIRIEFNGTDSKPTTIVCTKGKLKKSVTGIKPTCPKGYVKK